MKQAWRLLLSTATIAASILLYLVALPEAAGAQGLGCSATLNGTDIKAFSTPKKALRVRGDARVAVTGTAVDAFFTPGESRALTYLVKLELAGASWTATSGVSDGETWAGSVNVADYASRGQGIYKVAAYSKSQLGNECFGKAYVKVEGDGGPLSTTAGQVAAGVGALGAAGAFAAGARGSTQVDEAVKDTVGNWLENQANEPGETSDALEQKRMAAEAERLHGHELHLMSFCLPLIVVAAVATIRAVASDVGHHLTAAIGGMFR